MKFLSGWFRWQIGAFRKLSLPRVWWWYYNMFHDAVWPTRMVWWGILSGVYLMILLVLMWIVGLETVPNFVVLGAFPTGILGISLLEYKVYLYDHNP